MEHLVNHYHFTKPQFYTSYVQPNTIFTKAQKHALAKAKLNLAWHKYFIALENIGRDIFYLEM